MGRLAVLVPSRGRPENIDRLQEAMDETCRGHTRLFLGLDEDDDWGAYTVKRKREWAVRRMIIGPRTNLVGWLNRLAELYLDFDYLGHIGDDCIPRTDGWDVRLMEALQDNLFAFPNDLDPGRPAGSLSIHCFMRSEVVKKLGYMGPPSIQHMYVDPVWYAWGTRTSIAFLEDVVVEHMHYSFGKSGVDESYKRTTALIPQDCLAYNAYCAFGMNDDIRKLGGTPFTAEEMVAFNRDLNIPERM